MEEAPNLAPAPAGVNRNLPPCAGRSAGSPRFHHYC